MVTSNFYKGITEWSYHRIVRKSKMGTTIHYKVTVKLNVKTITLTIIENYPDTL